uniref:t-SNARE coiled-coil homology domain-containing protein n=1 Tax=Phytophthora ramorum TaxID=164328 RepID=H3GEG7_PHYRM
MASQREEASGVQWQQRHTQALRDAAESLDVGRATAHSLSLQAEQLGRSERVLDETQATVAMSRRVLRGMTWGGWLYNKFSAAPELAGDKGSAEWWTESAVAAAESSCCDSMEDIHDKFLRDLEPQLAELKEQSLALGSALDTQNEQLGRMDSKIGQVHHDMKRVGIQANKIAGRKVSVMFRFRCAFQEVQTGRFLRDVDGEALLSADVVVDGLRGGDFNSYEQFLVESKSTTPIFCLASYFGLGVSEVALGQLMKLKTRVGDATGVGTASVDVVENIQTWRTVVHQGMPRPYVYENENYMLTMCEDLDFLDQAGELAEWLGFRLLRNPFIVNEALDDVVSSRLALSVHDDRSLKYWNSTSWKLNNKLATKRVGLPNASEASPSRQASKARWKQQPPPPPLIKPLASICPEDDVVDGLRIATAQEVLLEEESFHGRLRGLRAAREYVDRGPSVLEPNDVDNNAPSPTIYDAMAALNIQLRTCRDMYRQEVLKTYNRLAERLERCLSSLEGDEKYVGGALDICKGQLSELRLEKDKQRATRHTKKQQEESTKRSNGRQKAEERRKVRSKKKSLQRRSASDLVQESLQQKEDIIYENIAVDFQSDIRAIESKKSGGPAREQESPGTCQKLEEKRQRAIYQKRARLEQHARTLKDMELVLDRRRAENVAMKWEDALARAVEREARRKTILRSRKARLDRVASCAMFKCMHEMNGKRFLVSVYIRHARGYDLEGLRIVAYDPSSSAAFTMEMPLRVFNSLGYGRTSDGLGGFYRYSLVAVYLRRNDPSILRFVVGSCYGQEFLLTEHAVSARWLIVGSDLDVQWKSSAHAVIVWKHHTDALEMQEELYSSQDGAEGSANNAVGPRIYSSEVIVRRVRYSVHLYDTDETKYTVELVPKAQKGQIEQSKPVGDRLVLNKRDVNPYDVHLSSSSFADLFSLICFEHNPPQEPKREDASDPATRLKWKATVSPKWTVGLEYSGNEREGGDEECPSCSTYDAARTKLHANDVGVPETVFDCTTSCSNCAMIQQRRLRAIKELVIHAGAIAPESLEVIYHGYCDVCATLAPPIVLVVGSAFSATMNWLLPLLEQYFVSFDCGKHGFLRFAEGDQGHVIAEEGIHVRETVLQTLARDQVAVLFNADCASFRVTWRML